MITFGYLAGYARREIYMGAVRRDSRLSTLINQISDELSFCGVEIYKNTSKLLADFDGIVYVTGDPLNTLPTLTKQIQATECFPPKKTLQPWNELVFNLYPNNSIVEMLRAGHIQAVGINYPEQRLYGGHLFICKNCIELSVSLSSVDILFGLWRDVILGLQSLLAIISNLEGANLIGDITKWRLTLRPGMLYEEIFNGRNS